MTITIYLQNSLLLNFNQFLLLLKYTYYVYTGKAVASFPQYQTSLIAKIVNLWLNKIDHPRTRSCYWKFKFLKSTKMSEAIFQKRLVGYEIALKRCKNSRLLKRMP